MIIILATRSAFIFLTRKALNSVKMFSKNRKWCNRHKNSMQHKQLAWWVKSAHQIIAMGNWKSNKYINSFFVMLEFKQLRSTILIIRLLVGIPPISSSPSIEWLENQLSGWKSNMHPWQCDFEGGGLSQFWHNVFLTHVMKEQPIGA